jgi:hypothetical protein
MNRMVCEHLKALDQELQSRGISAHRYERSWWNPTAPSGEWFFFDCYLDPESLRKRLGLPPFVEYSEYDGRVAGQEAGFFCCRCNSAIMGHHLYYAAGKEVFR